METRTEKGDQSPKVLRDPSRVLLIADSVLPGNALTRELEGHLEVRSGEVEVLVISPALAHTRIDQELGNVDPVLPETNERMNEAVDELKRAGFNARGQVGDIDPLTAIGDGLAQFDAGEIVVVANDDGNAEPGEAGLWQRIEGEFHQPLTMIKVAPNAVSELPEVVSSQHSPARRKTGEELIRETRNVPPFSRRDLLGILFGVFGTIALGWIAVLAGSDDSQASLDTASAVIVLIAIGAFLINVAHVVGLVFFESVGYKGIWEKFMARMSIIVTSLGLVIALVFLLLD